MKYLSLFSGIGGFEVAIHKVFPEAECIGYSEIKPYAIKVYKQHFPEHQNLGDISKINKNQLMSLIKKEKGCDLIVGGFPCTNLSSLANISKFGDNNGLNGNQSKLFYEFLRIIKIVKDVNKDVKIIIENNSSMSKTNQEIITNILKKIGINIFKYPINAALFGVQWRCRLYWTNFEVNLNNIKCDQYWENVLEPIDNINKFASQKRINILNTLYQYRDIKYHIVKKYSKIIDFSDGKYDIINQQCDGHLKSRFDLSFHSDNMDIQEYKPYNVGKSRTIITSGGGNNMLIDRRYINTGFKLRPFTTLEIERLFRFPDNYTNCNLSKTKRDNLLGNSIVISVVEYILNYI